MRRADYPFSREFFSPHKTIKGMKIQENFQRFPRNNHIKYKQEYSYNRNNYHYTNSNLIFDKRKNKMAYRGRPNC